MMNYNTSVVFPIVNLKASLAGAISQLCLNGAEFKSVIHRMMQEELFFANADVLLL